MATRGEWKVRVRQWRSSGLTAGAFAEQEGLNEQTLRHWAWQLERAQGSTSTGFVEVVVPTATPSRETVIEVVLRDGVRLRVESGFDPETLKQVICLLESR
jgi:hypothetical protein